MGMYERIYELCTEEGIKPGTLCAELGISRGILSDLKAGRTQELSTKNARLIADYFNVSTDYILGNVSEPFFYLDNERILKEINSYGDEKEDAPAISEDIAEFLNVFRQLTPKNQEILVETAKGLLRGQ